VNKNHRQSGGATCIGHEPSIGVGNVECVVIGCVDICCSETCLQPRFGHLGFAEVFSHPGLDVNTDKCAALQEFRARAGIGRRMRHGQRRNNRGLLTVSHQADAQYRQSRGGQKVSSKWAASFVHEEHCIGTLRGFKVTLPD